MYIGQLPPNMHVVKESSWRSAETAADLNWCDALIVHFLDVAKSRLALRAPPGVPIVWSGWGGDYYHLLPGGERAMLGDETVAAMRVIRQRDVRRRSLGTLLRHVLRRVRGTLVNDRLIRRAISRVELFSAPIPNELPLVQQGLSPVFHAQYVQLNYGSVERTFSVGESGATGRDILVGNSATPTNNHLELFDLLARLDLGARRIVAPLSYGSPLYREAVVSRGRQLFGTRFHPLTEFLPLERYNVELSRCAVVVMGHRRQQALGNICTLMCRGARIVVDERSTVYQFFKSRGAYISTLRELAASPNGDPFAPLGEAEQARNRAVVEAFWGEGVVRGNVVRLIRTLERLIQDGPVLSLHS